MPEYGMTLVRAETGEVVPSIPVVPDPATAPIEKLRQACLSVREWVDECDDIVTGHEVLDRVLMVESYLSRKKQAAEAQEAARWLEVRLGELLGEPLSPQEYGARKGSTAKEPLTHNEREQFRKLAEYRNVVAELVPNSRRRILRVIRDRLAAANRTVEAAQLEEAEPPNIEPRHGDFREVLNDLSDVDAIITDPPYPKEYLPLLRDLAAWADKVLAPDGVLAVLMGQTHLPEVYRLLDGHRPYRWTGCYITTGPGYVSHPRRVQSQWKPLLVYGGGPRFSDLIASSGDDKEHHHWGQNYDAFHAIVERLTSPGQLVVDPFMGGGTTLLAARALGRNAIGCDIDADAVRTAESRLA